MPEAPKASGPPPREARTALSALAWNSSAALAGALLQLCYTAFTARVVRPEGFGAFAAASAALTVLGYVAGAGLSTYLLRAEELTRRTVRTAYRVAFGAGVLCCVAAQFAAAPAAVLWGLPDIDPIVRLFGLFFLTQPASLVATAALRRLDHARFASLAEAWAQFAGMACGAALLAAGWSPYGLVAAQVIAPTLVLAAASARLRTCPLPDGEPVRAAAMLGVSGAFAGYGVIQALVADVALWAVTRHLGSAVGGQFSRAVLIVGIPSSLLAQSLRRAFLPSMARVNGQGDSLGGMLPGILGMSSALACVCFGALAGVGPPVAALLLGPGWGTVGLLVPVLAAGAPLVLLCAVGYAVDETRKKMLFLLYTQLLVLAVMAACTAAAVTQVRHLAVFALGGSLAAGAGHALQIARWRRDGLIRPAALVRPYAVHALIGAALAMSGWLGVRAADGSPVAGLAGGLLGMSVVAAACWVLRRRLPLYSAAVANGLLRG
ncbi:oligosaccharide flippase family protein [Yinghuangia soli]|uniref:Oligosaccharide flippase family protein n=1 Tax=Yinghuangia soli TaxID=2908204 RepID=A0AA41Q377_9ACTN|nr:oligosaccharide flippase family protein [Yinghuangia soli]MCF2529272.1 oligosaccharide flippase family protein [Yinghuangia soli]